jgi:hypothetical protein
MKLNFDRSSFEKRKNGERKPLSESPLTLALLTGALGLFGAGLSNYLQYRSNIELEMIKYKTNSRLESSKTASALILKAIETGNTKSAINNLQFLVKAGFIKDSLGAIADLSESPEAAPVLPVSSEVVVPNTPSSQEFFFKKYRSKFGPLSANAESVLTKLFDFIAQDKKMNDIHYAAYILATIKFETANSWLPTTEFGSDAFLNERYGPTAALGGL